MHSDTTTWYCRNYFQNNVSQASMLTVFETIWNCREKAKTLTRTFWDYLKRYLTLQWVHDLTSLKGVGAWGRPTFPLKCENKDGNRCIWSYVKQYFGTAENIWKRRTTQGAICRYLIRYGSACELTPNHLFLNQRSPILASPFLWYILWWP